MSLLGQFETSVSFTSGLPAWFWPTYTIIVILIIASVWRVFTKAGHPGWAALIPIYNFYVLIKVAKRPGWWLLLMLIPFVNLVVAIIVAIDVAKAFGKGTGFGLGLAFLSFIFYPILAWGSATYDGGMPAAPELPAA